jgi:hypothetical protein
MAGSSVHRIDLSQLIARFPGDSVLIRQLMLRDETFRGICEDYMLAKASLSWFEAQPNAEGRPEVADFRSLIPSLELEIETFLQRVK